MQKLNSPTFSVTSESFLPLLTQLDDCIEYLNKHVSVIKAAFWMLNAFVFVHR